MWNMYQDLIDQGELEEQKFRKDNCWMLGEDIYDI
jgi:hypothetical protein